MALNQELDFSTSAASNTDVVGVGIQEGMFPDKVNDAMRNMLKTRADAITRHVVKAASPQTAVKTDHNQFWRFTVAATLNLTAAATLTDGWALWVRANGGAVTVDPNGAETIDGAATLVIADGMTALIICTGTAFFTVNAGPVGPAYAALDTLTQKATNVASAGTTDIGAATGRFVHITGTTTITAFGTKAAGVERELVFDGALTLTYNATSLILPGSANILTEAGDTAIMVSEGSGNWKCLSYQRATGSVIRSGTVAATTSGTSVDFTGLPAGIKRITVAIAGVSTNGTSTLLLQIGDSGGIENTGYLGATTVMSTAVSTANATTGFAWGNAAAASVHHGALVLTLLDPSTNTWACEGVVGLSNVAVSATTAGSKPLSATLDRIRLTTAGGTDAFDAGSVNILYE